MPAFKLIIFFSFDIITFMSDTRSLMLHKWCVIVLIVKMNKQKKYIYIYRIKECTNLEWQKPSSVFFLLLCFLSAALHKEISLINIIFFSGFIYFFFFHNEQKLLIGEIIRFFFAKINGYNLLSEVGKNIRKIM